MRCSTTSPQIEAVADVRLSRVSHRRSTSCGPVLLSGDGPTVALSPATTAVSSATSRHGPFRKPSKEQLLNFVTVGSLSSSSKLSIESVHVNGASSQVRNSAKDSVADLNLTGISISSLDGASDATVPDNVARKLNRHDSKEKIMSFLCEPASSSPAGLPPLPPVENIDCVDNEPGDALKEDMMSFSPGQVRNYDTGIADIDEDDDLTRVSPPSGDVSDTRPRTRSDSLELMSFSVNALNVRMPQASDAKYTGKSDYVRAGMLARDLQLAKKQSEHIHLMRAAAESKRALAEHYDEVGQQIGDILTRWEMDNSIEKGIRALLSSLHEVLWEGARWNPVKMADLIQPSSVKRYYHKAMRVVHPDKVDSANCNQKFVAERSFEALNKAWKKFSAAEM